MEENKPEVTSKITAEKTAEVATPKPRKPRVSKTTNEVDTTIDIPVAEENQQEPFIEELDSPIELEQKKSQKNINIYLVREDTEIPILLASGFELFITNIVFKLAIRSISKIPKGNFFIIDSVSLLIK